MNINQTKRKTGARWNVMERLAGERTSLRSGGRPSVLTNQKVQRRQRKLPELHLDATRTERHHLPRESNRHRSSVSPHPFGVKLLEGGVVLAAGISLFVKNGISHIAGWIRDGRDMVSRSNPDTHHAWTDEEYEEGIWTGDDGEEKSQHAAEPNWDNDHPETNRHDSRIEQNDLDNRETDFIHAQPPIVLLREEVEIKKVSMLDAEENGLPEEELVDQAGALRAMFSDSVRPT